MKFVKGVLNAVGNISCDTHLRLCSHIGSGSVFRYLIEQLLPLFLVGAHVFVVVNKVQGDDATVQFGVAHHDSQAH